MRVPFGNIRFFIVGRVGYESIKYALRKLDHYSFNHATEPLISDLVWCKKCGVIYHA